MIIDVHAHVLSNTFMAELARDKTFGIELMDDNYTYLVPAYGPFDPPIYHFEERVAGLASRGVDAQLVSPVPTLISWPGGAASTREPQNRSHSPRDVSKGWRRCVWVSPIASWTNSTVRWISMVLSACKLELTAVIARSTTRHSIHYSA